MRSVRATSMGAIAALFLGLAGPAHAFIDSGPLADFLNEFRQPSIPRAAGSHQADAHPAPSRGLAGPAHAFIDSGPLADFLNEFRQQSIPREVVSYKGDEKPGT